MFDCVLVIAMTAQGKCITENPISLQDNEGYISGSSISNPNHRSSHCIMEIAAQQGQNVDVSIIDFQPLSSSQTCSQLGYVIDTEANKNISICKPHQRSAHIYQSKGRKVQIQLNSNDKQPDRTKEEYVIHYKGKQYAKNVMSYIIPFINEEGCKQLYA